MCVRRNDEGCSATQHPDFLRSRQRSLTPSHTTNALDSKECFLYRKVRAVFSFHRRTTSSDRRDSEVRRVSVTSNIFSDS